MQTRVQKDNFDPKTEQNTKMHTLNITKVNRCYTRMERVHNKQFISKTSKETRFGLPFYAFLKVP